MDETKNCPFCAEEIKTAAIKCKHCGESLSKKAVTQARKRESSQKQNVGCLPATLILGFLIVFLAQMCDSVSKHPSSGSAENKPSSNRSRFYETTIPKCTGETYEQAIRDYSDSLTKSEKMKLLAGLASLDTWYNMNAKANGLSMSPMDTNKFLAEAACGRSGFDVERLGRKMIGASS